MGVPPANTSRVRSYPSTRKPRLPCCPKWAGWYDLVMDLELDPEADDALERLHQQDPRTANRVEDLLDVVASSPGDRSVRTRELRSPPSPLPIWGFTVRATDFDYLVLWRRDGDTAVVVYVGRDFA